MNADQTTLDIWINALSLLLAINDAFQTLMFYFPLSFQILKFNRMHLNIHAECQLTITYQQIQKQPQSSTFAHIHVH